MFRQDRFTSWLGIELIDVKPGSATLRMKIREEMMNGFNICHGGIPFSLADSAVAFAANSHGILSVSIENSISYTEKIQEKDVLTATARELHRNNKIAVYNVVITKQDNTTVGLFRGTVYRTNSMLPGLHE